MGFPKINKDDLMRGLYHYQPNFDKINEAMTESNRIKRKKDNFRFWMPVIISIIALGISIYAALKPSEKQNLLIIKDTVRIAVPYNSPKNESLKSAEIKKK